MLDAVFVPVFAIIRFRFENGCRLHHLGGRKHLQVAGSLHVVVVVVAGWHHVPRMTIGSFWVTSKRRSHRTVLGTVMHSARMILHSSRLLLLHHIAVGLDKCVVVAVSGWKDPHEIGFEFTDQG